MEPFAFGPFRLDLEASRLLRDGVELELRPQAFHALQALVQHSGQYLNYCQMIQEGWGGTFVSRHTVAVTVGEAKKALKEYGSWICYRPKLGYRLEIPHSADLLRIGWHVLERRTREGFEKALECFERAASEDGTDIKALEGISLCYLMFGSYSMKRPREMYPRFLEAHQRAVALRGLIPELRSDRAFGLYMFERKFLEAERELLQARSEDPKLSIIHVRLAMLYMTLGRFDEAMDAVREAYAADPLQTLAPATELSLNFFRREYQCAMVSAQKALELHPYLQLSRAFSAQALEYSGRVSEALEQHRLACMLYPDLPWLRALEGGCMARNGRTEEALLILAELDQLGETSYVDGYYLAGLVAALGMYDRAFRELDRAWEDQSAPLNLIHIDPKMDSLRDDPRFESLRNRLFADGSLAEAGVLVAAR